jgi:hypothetical protein
VGRVAGGAVGRVRRGHHLFPSGLVISGRLWRRRWQVGRKAVSGNPARAVRQYSTAPTLATPRQMLAKSWRTRDHLLYHVETLKLPDQR